MKVKLHPGVELDLLTQNELAATLAQALSGFARGPLTVRATVDIPLDSNGNTSVGSTSPAPFSLFSVPSGYQFALHRLALKPDGYTFAAPYTSGDGYLEIQRVGRMVDGISLNSPGLPIVFTAGTADAVIFDNRESVDLLVVTGPASTSVQASLQGTLEPLTIT